MIHETEFARDPKHPRSSPSVRELVAEPAMLPLLVRRADEGLPERGIVIGDVASTVDLRKWAVLRNDRWLMAGGAEFFGALLKQPVSRSQPKPAEGTELFVCGSASEVTRKSLWPARKHRACECSRCRRLVLTPAGLRLELEDYAVQDLADAQFQE